MGLYKWLIGGKDATKRNEGSATKKSPADSAARSGNPHVVGNATSTRSECKKGNNSAGNDKKPGWPRKLIMKLKEALNTLSRLIQRQGKKIEEDHGELKDRLSRLEDQYVHVAQLVAGMAEHQQASRARREDRATRDKAFRQQAKQAIRGIHDQLDTLEDRFHKQAPSSRGHSQQFRKQVTGLLKNLEQEISDIRPQDQLMVEICMEVGQLDRSISHLQQQMEQYPSRCSAIENLEEVVSLLEGIRTSLVGILHSRGARLIDSIEGDIDPSLHEPTHDRRPRPDGAKGAGEVIRPGLVAKEDDHNRTLRPARVVLYEDVQL